VSLPVGAMHVPGAGGVTPLKPVIFTTIGSSFSPIITIEGDAEVTWIFDDDTVSNELSPTKDYGSAGTRQNRLIVEPWSAIRTINVGYVAGDGGQCDGDYQIGLLAQQNVSAITGLQHAAPYLRRIGIDENPITAIDLSGCALLIDIEACYADLVTVDVSGCTAARRLCFEDNQLTALDISDCVLLEDLRGAANNYLEITVPDGGLPELWHWCVRDQSQITQSWPIDLFPAVMQCWIWHTNQSSVPEIFTLNFCNSFMAYENSYSEAAVDAILVVLAANSISNGECNLSDSSPPSATGLAAVATLEGRGWTVIVET
jgi:hypothetical protein